MNTQRTAPDPNYPLLFSDGYDRSIRGRAVEGMTIACHQHPEWGAFTLLRDRNGWTKRSHSGSGTSMIDEDEFRFWYDLPSGMAYTFDTATGYDR
jgi:hypothetical protein